ncbi:hypothetical protein PQR66_08710 [Paraburkholderia agricolaris]|uniref:CR-type domain-containing protein n=1 Tax=Paraburkholderia agricolaris TaxID=2152888 RepID=A0ABW8ZIQ6_9BURK
MIDLKEQAGSAMNVRSQLGESVGDPQVTLGALAFADDLGRLLWRMKYGQDVKRAGVQRATLLLASRIRWSGKFARKKFTGLNHEANRARRSGVKGEKVERAMSDIVERFARRVIVEWVVELCPCCNGRGVTGRAASQVTPLVVEVECETCHGARSVVVSEERIPFAHNGRHPIVYREYERCGTCNGEGKQRIEQKPRGNGRQICPACDGTSRYAVDDAARASALGVSLGIYRAHWAVHFRGMLALLDRIDGSAADIVRAKVRR